MAYNKKWYKTVSVKRQMKQSLTSICRDVGRVLFLCGVQFGKQLVLDSHPNETS